MTGSTSPATGAETRTYRSTPRPGDGKAMGAVETMEGKPAACAQASANELDMGLQTSELASGSLIRYTINTDQ
ncbi:hypothetical protein RS75_11215 [Rhizobium nepotum 39/7]|uniref:Uncharacterized protein n=1 Tax=Rhizobium nepotum 39/7 TaxID=1368418 RepID=A0ABR5CSF5_9HYPH|nr:hypothetical protein RS75_11215 [Rhizobium nepotum 39/7]